MKNDINNDNFAWESKEGQLTVDVIETPEKIIIRSAIAGVKPEDLDINVTHDIITIRGERQQQKERLNETVHFQECFWGTFSRSIVLPASVKPDEADAIIKNGILTLTIPKIISEANIKVHEILT